MEILSDDFCAWLDDASRDLERDLERRKEALEDQLRVVWALQKVEEIAIANNLTLPEELAATVDSLDDEQTEPKIVIENAADVIAEGGVKNVRNT